MYPCFARGRTFYHQVFASADQEHHERANIMDSLYMARSGAIHQGVFTSGSLTADGRARVDAFVDRWHCRRSAQRSGRILAALLEHLVQGVRWANKETRALFEAPTKMALILNNLSFKGPGNKTSNNVTKAEKLAE